MEIELPTQGHQKSSDKRKHDSLDADPHFHGYANALAYFLSECNQGQCVQVNVVAKLLRHGVVLVVLTAPPSTAHAASEAVDQLLQVFVYLDVP